MWLENFAVLVKMLHSAFLFWFTGWVIPWISAVMPRNAPLERGREMLWLKWEKAQILPPNPKLRMSEEFSSGHRNLHREFISPLFQFAFGRILNFVSFGTCQNTGEKKRRVSPYFRDSRYLGGIQASIPTLPSLRSDFWHFFPPHNFL